MPTLSVRSYAKKHFYAPSNASKRANYQNRKSHIKTVSESEARKNELSVYLGKKLDATNFLTAVQWENLKSDILGFPMASGNTFVNKSNVDSVLCAEICKQENISLAQCFYAAQ